MQSAFNAVTSGSSHAIRSSVSTKNPRSPLISSPRARSTAITVSASAMVASFITLGLATDCAANRWKTFLSHTSRAAVASGFGMIGHASIAAKWWHGRVGAWANAVIGS